MPYTINYTDVANKGSITVEDSTINRETTLGFPGRNSTAYGATIAENFLHLLESFASNNPPINPVEGQLWYDNTLEEEKLMVYNDTNWVPASGISKSINTPALVFMTYLNDVTDGGETQWLYQEKQIQPKKGLTVLWPTDFTHTHRGVVSPTQPKTIATGWYNYLDVRSIMV